MPRIKRMSKLAIIGGRDFNDQKLFDQSIVDFTKKYGKITLVVSGKARGADTMGANFARRFVIELIEYVPEWDLYGKRAGFIRNEYIIRDCDICIAFWDGKSKGTKSSIDLCTKMNKECIIIRY